MHLKNFIYNFLTKYLHDFCASETGASEHVLGEVLTAMDGVEGQTGQIILMAATNRLDKLDSVSFKF